MEPNTSAAPAFDVADYEIADTAILTVKNMRGDDLLIGADKVNPVTIELYSPGSPQGVKALHKSGRQAQLRTFRTIRGEFDPNDAAQAENEHVEKLVAFTRTVNNFPMPVDAIYRNSKLGYITKQVDEFINKYASFSKGSSPS